MLKCINNFPKGTMFGFQATGQQALNFDVPNFPNCWKLTSQKKGLNSKQFFCWVWVGGRLGEVWLLPAPMPMPRRRRGSWDP